MFARLMLALARWRFDRRMERGTPVQVDVRLRGPFVITPPAQTWTTGPNVRFTFKES